MDMIAIDIGNSTLSLAVFADRELNRSEHIRLNEVSQPRLEETMREYRAICGEQPLGARTVPVVSSSVNQEEFARVERSVYTALKQDIILIGRDFPLEMKTAVENPEAVGTDRLVTAFAAYEVIQSSAVVADFGSATTIDCVNEQGIFVGGTILPGLNMAARALHDYTDALPKVEPRVPESVFGINTSDAINNGIYYGTIGALREIVERFAEELGHWPQVVATGGYSKLIAARCEFIDSLVPDLCLNGLYLAYRRYREAMESGEVEF